MPRPHRAAPRRATRCVRPCVTRVIGSQLDFKGRRSPSSAPPRVRVSRRLARRPTAGSERELYENYTRHARRSGASERVVEGRRNRAARGTRTRRVLHGSAREKERDKPGGIEERENERGGLSDRRCGKERKGSVRQGRPAGIALEECERDRVETCHGGVTRTKRARERTRRTKSLTGVSTWAR